MQTFSRDFLKSRVEGLFGVKSATSVLLLLCEDLSAALTIFVSTLISPALETSEVALHGVPTSSSLIVSRDSCQAGCSCLSSQQV